MQSFDASSIIYGWENYPVGKFLRLWAWLGNEISREQFVMSEIALSEVRAKHPECYDWLVEAGVKVYKVNQMVVDESIRISQALGIVNDQYGTGVGENDILIIATANVNGFDLISNESLQPILPLNMNKYKIPAVCALQDVNVTCLDFLDLINNSNDTF